MLGIAECRVLNAEVNFELYPSAFISAFNIQHSALPKRPATMGSGCKSHAVSPL